MAKPQGLLVPAAEKLGRALAAPGGPGPAGHDAADLRRRDGPQVLGLGARRAGGQRSADGGGAVLRPAAGGWHAEHVVFELVDKVYKGRSAIWSRVFMDVFCAVVFGALGVALWGFAGRTMEEGEVSVYLKWPVGWFVYLMAVLVCLSGLMHLLRALTLDLHPEQEEAHSSGPTT
ncbi:TRAP transporter small permease subunit [Ramlibacter terrae]|uniref:TRAP transporter small permease protein n=1 Tax=Ramlibacter terrae TaxID=2732511 RepID=A0ABX6P5P3_9BURK|nr:TRAP transporter small permease subunit [Ramlibacter terrae]